jgi:hypothetical protein
MLNICALKGVLFKNHKIQRTKFLYIITDFDQHFNLNFSAIFIS